MKKNYFSLLAIMGFVLFTLCGCGKEKITVTGQDGTEYESYQECCAAEDFQAAHQFLAKMENSEDWKDGYSDAKEYVFKNEALYLMSIGDESAKKRLIYLLKEEDGNDEHINMLMDLAIENDDVSFIKTLTNQYKNGIGTDVLRKIVGCLYVKKENENINFLTTLLNRFDKLEIMINAAVEKDDEETAVTLSKQFKGEMDFLTFRNVTDFLFTKKSENYQDIFNTLSSHMDYDNTDFIKYALEKKQLKIVQESLKNNIENYNDDMITSLASLNNNNISELILSRLSKYESKIPKRPESGTFVQYSCGTLESNCKNYVGAVKDYNEECMDLMTIAINCKNLFLANRVMVKVKPNLSYKSMPNSVQKTIKEENLFGTTSKEQSWDKIIISGNIDRDDIEIARKTLNEAIRSGAFK